MNEDVAEAEEKVLRIEKRKMDRGMKGIQEE